MKKVLIVIGTRPEAIKMAPVYQMFKDDSNFNIKICSTGQHKEMLKQVLDFFEISPDFDLEIMRANQDLYTITSDILLGLKNIIDDFEPDYVFVHGDTSTSFAAGLASFYSKIPVCHVEAGLRTFNLSSPFPEEANRQLTSRITKFHFAPTYKAKENLIMEGVSENQICVTGNTVIDALKYGLIKLNEFESEELNDLNSILDLSKKILLVTGHRRENHGEGILNICLALKNIARTFKDICIVYPVHLNPKISSPVNELLDGVDNIKLISPLSYPTFIYLMNKSWAILTDSGGIQEEAPSIGKPVFVMRENTERPEALEAGTVKLVGTDPQVIFNEVQKLYNDIGEYNSYLKKSNPYGDGLASKRILKFLNEKISC